MVNSGVHGGMRSTRSRIATAVAAIIGMLAVAVVTGFFQLLAIGLGTCGGDGGSPYAARDSAQGHVCDFLDRGGMTLVLAIEIAALVAAAVVLVLWARRRIARRRGRGLRGGGLAAAARRAVGPVSAPSDGCSKADQARRTRGAVRDRASAGRARRHAPGETSARGHRLGRPRASGARGLQDLLGRDHDEVPVALVLALGVAHASPGACTPPGSACSAGGPCSSASSS